MPEQPFFSVILNGCKSDIHFLIHALQGLRNQLYTEFELICLFQDLQEKEEAKRITEMCKQIPQFHNAVFSTKDPRSHIGNKEQRIGLDMANGRYITWLNIDNLVYPHWLLSHKKQINCAKIISIVNIDYWLEGIYDGILPRSLEKGHIDLLNFAVPVKWARQADAFGVDTWTHYESDWMTFERIYKEFEDYTWDRTAHPCASHC